MPESLHVLDLSEVDKRGARQTPFVVWGLGCRVAVASDREGNETCSGNSRNPKLAVNST